MEIMAKTKSVRVSPRKMRLVADVIRGMQVTKAVNSLSLLEKRASLPILKTIKSAMANAINNAKLTEVNLIIKSIEISEGQALKRYHPSTRGRVHPYKKRSSHIRVILEDKYGTKN